MNFLKCSMLALLIGGVVLGTSATDVDAHGLRGCCTPQCAPPPPPPVPIVLEVCHPCTGCKYLVKVCVPACCATCPPRVCFQNTLIGAGRTVYEWDCGHTVVIRYPRHGGYRVFQRG